MRPSRTLKRLPRGKPCVRPSNSRIFRISSSPIANRSPPKTRRPGQPLPGDFDAPGQLVLAYLSTSCRGRREKAVATGTRFHRTVQLIHLSGREPGHDVARQAAGCRGPEQGFGQKQTHGRPFSMPFPTPCSSSDVEGLWWVATRAALAFFRRCQEQVAGLLCHDLFRDSFGREGATLLATIMSGIDPLLLEPGRAVVRHLMVQALRMGNRRDGWSGRSPTSRVIGR